MSEQSGLRGLTVIELLTVLVVIALVLTLAVPPFGELLERRRVEGFFGELHADMQFARTEAVARNRPVRLTFSNGGRCYLIHTHPAGAGASGCAASGPSTIGTDAVEIKTVQLPAGSTLTLMPQAAVTYIEYDPVRGTASWDGSATAGAVDVGSSAGAWRLQVNALTSGRVQVCSPGGSMKGYETCS